MEAFNYLTVMVSIVVGIGLTQLLAGIGNFVQIRRRVRFYWLHTGWVLLLIVLHLHMWWSLWVLRLVTEWTYGTFAYVLLGPALLVIASHVIIPELIGERIDVERHYYDTHRIFFSLLAATGCGPCSSKRSPACGRSWCRSGSCRSPERRCSCSVPSSGTSASMRWRRS